MSPLTAFLVGVAVGVVLTVLVLEWLARRAEQQAFNQFWG